MIFRRNAYSILQEFNLNLLLVPVAVGGYRAVAGEGGAVHEVPGLVPAPALLNQESAGGVSLSTGRDNTVKGLSILGKYCVEI